VDWVGLFLRLEGRIGRKAFWIGFGAVLAAFFFFDLLTRGLGLTVLVMLALIYPLAAVLVKRLHDRGRSGWWAGVLAAPFGAGLLVAMIARFAGGGVDAIERAASGAIWIAILALAALAIYELGLREGEPGYSEHGPPPLA
jgi:uncharacterized membrane protein YhaH (DUF805 family)